MAVHQLQLVAVQIHQTLLHADTLQIHVLQIVPLPKDVVRQKHQLAAVYQEPYLAAVEVELAVSHANAID
jgi:hypothetical protein